MVTALLLKQKTLMGGCLILALYLIVSVQAVFESFTIPSSQQVTRALRLEDGGSVIEKASTITGTIRASGGPANDIRFYVTDPNNTTVVYYGNVTFTSFSFVAPTTGTYTAHFDNSLSMFSKGVTLNYSIEPPILGIPHDLFLIIVAVFAVVIVVVIIVVIIVIIHRRKRKRLKKPAKKTASKNT